MAFMEHQIEFGEWFIYESKDGGTYAIEHEHLDVIPQDDIVSVIEQRTEGYGARVSTPGYLDCSDWCVFDTEEEAQEYLDEYYPDDEEDDNE